MRSFFKIVKRMFCIGFVEELFVFVGIIDDFYLVFEFLGEVVIVYRWMGEFLKVCLIVEGIFDESVKNCVLKVLEGGEDVGYE